MLLGLPRSGSILIQAPVLAALLAVPARADYPRDFRAALDGFRGNNSGAVDKVYLKDASGSGKDRLLALYELGCFAHLAGDYKKSIGFFNTADSVAHEYEAQAVVSAGAAGRTVGAVILNDTVLKYEGQGYEKVMSRTLNAINFLMAGDMEGARVEVRKAEEYQRLERERHQKEVQKTGAGDNARLGDPGVQANYGRMFDFVKNVRNSFENAFTYYLASQIYMTQGEDGLNDAMVEIRKAYELAPQAPAVRAAYLEIAAAQGGGALDRARAELKVADQAPLHDPRNTASLVVCYESGLVPELEEVKINLFAVDRNYGVAFPIYRNFEVPQYPVSVALPPPAQPVTTTPVVDTRTLAVKSLQERMPGILARGLAGLVAKVQAQKKAEKTFGLFGGLVASVASAIVTEADRRSWLSLPAQVQVAKCNLFPGPNTLTLAGPGWIQPVTLNVDPGSCTFLVVRAFPGFRRVDFRTVGGTPAQPPPAAPVAVNPAPVSGS